MKKWDNIEYQKIVKASLDEQTLHVEFGNGDKAEIPFDSILPLGASKIDKTSFFYNEYEISINSEQSNILIPWDKIRVLTDPSFAKEMAKIAEEEARLIGQRLKSLRERKGIKSQDLAERANVTPQTISRIEKGHTDVSFGTLKKILAAMGSSLRDLAAEERLADSEKTPMTYRDILKKLNKSGIETFLINKIIPKEITDKLVKTKGALPDLLADEISIHLNRVFGWTDRDIWTEDQLTFEESPAQLAYFKTPSKGNLNQIKAYSHYAYYLANIVSRINIQEAKIEYPGDIDEFKEDFYKRYHEVELSNLINYAWDMGVIVIPLNDSGVFHGASWNINGKHVIVLKQKVTSHSRWIFDLLHELYHVFVHLEQPNTSVVEIEELNPFSKTDSVEELEANSFANQFIFGNRSEELVLKCLETANYRIEQLKNAVTQISKSEHLKPDFLANYLAFRLQMNGNNWWGTANSFQRTDPEPFAIAASILKERVSISNLNPIDRNLLVSAINN